MCSLFHKLSANVRTGKGLATSTLAGGAVINNVALPAAAAGSVTGGADDSMYSAVDTAGGVIFGIGNTSEGIKNAIGWMLDILPDSNGILFLPSLWDSSP
jgi:hypothetical protein